MCEVSAQQTQAQATSGAIFKPRSKIEQNPDKNARVATEETGRREEGCNGRRQETIYRLATALSVARLRGFQYSVKQESRVNR